MLTKEQVDDILKNINQELNEIKKNKLKANNDEDVIYKTQYMYKLNIKILVNNLKSQFQRNLDYI